MNEKRYAFYGHHKCATTWISALIGKVCRYTGLHGRVFGDPGQFDGDLAAYLEKHPVDFIHYINAQMSQVERMPPLPGFHIVRDPRDIIVSAYFSHLNSHPTERWPALVEYRDRLRSLDKQAGLLEEIVHSGNVMTDMGEWNYEQEQVLEIRFEDMVRDPCGVMVAAFAHLGLVDESALSLRSWIAEGRQRFLDRLHHRFGISLFDRGYPDRIPLSILLFHIYDGRFSKISGGRKPGEEDPRSHYRKGQPGDWRNHFTPVIAERFLATYPGLLQRLGYESGDDWVNTL